MTLIQDSHFYRIAFISIFTLLSLMRFWFKYKSGAIHDGLPLCKEGVWLVLLRWVLSVTLLLCVGLYIFRPDLLPLCYIRLTHMLRILGILICLIALVFLYLVHRELGKCFSSTLVLRENHRLIRSGPYAVVRHPMYSSYLLLFIGAFFISENWCIGLLGIAIILSLMTLRITKEEAMLLGRFGSDYEAYRKSTDMFIPYRYVLRFGKKKSS